VKRPSKLQRPDGSKQHFKIVYSRSHGLERTRLLENGENHLLRQKSRLVNVLNSFWCMCNTAKAEVQKRLIGLAFLDHVNKGWSAASFRVPIAQWWKVGHPGME